MRSDAGARYADTIRVDCSALSPMVARARRPGQRRARSPTSRERAAASTSPTAARAPPASARTSTTTTRCWRGRPSAACAWPPACKLYLQFGTIAVRDYCIERGYLDGVRGGRRADAAAVVRRLRQLRARARRPMPSQVTVSAINRNFPGRSGPGQVWLASPPTVAASAIAGDAGVVRRAAAPRRALARADALSSPAPRRRAALVRDCAPQVARSARANGP